MSRFLVKSVLNVFCIIPLTKKLLNEQPTPGPGNEYKSKHYEKIMRNFLLSKPEDIHIFQVCP